MNLIDQALLDDLSRRAAANERLRMNHNFHDSLDAPSQRLLNALEPGTRMPVHRHLHTSETYVLLRGRLRVMYYDDAGCLEDETVLDPAVGCYGVHIPRGQWHSLEVLAPGTVLFEAKDGPYMPLAPDCVLPL